LAVRSQRTTTDGGGEAYAYDVGRDWRIVRVPLVGMSPGTIEDVAPSVTEMLRTMANGVDRPMPARQGDLPSRHNVFDITPVILGGSPTDPANKAIVPLRRVLDLAHWWNERIEQLRR
jgi:hypothetical protein